MKTNLTTNLTILYTLLVIGTACTHKGCQNTNTGTPVDHEITIGIDTRDYIVYLPSHYAADPYPLVFMLHGASGSGEKFYNISVWNDVAENDSVLVVYPTGWPYDMLENGCGNNLVDHWNDYSLAPQVCNPNALKDDVAFFDLMMDEIIATYAVDTNRIYIAGFSNGAGMTSGLSIELSNRIAAVGTFAGTLEVDAMFVPQRNVPIHLGTGNLDSRVLDLTGFTDSIPMVMTLVMADPAMHDVVNTWLKSFNLDSNYTITTSTPKILTATFNVLSGDLDHGS